MAHECPDCGQMCYCGGDIDDCCNNFEADVMYCNHKCEAGDDWDCYDCVSGEEFKC